MDKIRRGVVVFVFFMVSHFTGVALAANVDIDLTTQLLTQQEFRDFSSEVGLAIAYLPLSPAEPLGPLGFDVGIKVTSVDIRDGNTYWQKATGANPPNMLVIPKIQVQKGLPFGIDVGAMYSKVPSSNVSLYGGEVKWAIVSGNIALPAIALRGSYSKLKGVDHLSIQTIGADLSVSKGIAFITPYAGIGQVWIKGASDLPGLGSEQIRNNKAFVGAKITLLPLNFVVEADFSDIPMYTGRLNIGF